MGEVKTKLANLVSAFKNSGARLACLCSSDEVYAREAAGAAQALKAASARVYLAGRPGAHEADYRTAGIEGFIFAGCDALAILQAAHDIIGNGHGPMESA
jgi:methylmalonyl-CoA mutase